MNNPKYIIIHTAAAGRDGKPVYQPFDVVRNYHLSLGWKDIGYHYYIEEDGKVVKGRDETTTGAHCKDGGMNSQSIGICCAGHGDLAGFTEKQYEALFALCIDIMERHHISAEKVLGHRETGANKRCPGNLVDMGAIRLVLMARTPQATPDNRITALEARVTALEARLDKGFNWAYEKGRSDGADEQSILEQEHHD